MAASKKTTKSTGATKAASSPVTSSKKRAAPSTKGKDQESKKPRTTTKSSPAPTKRSAAKASTPSPKTAKITKYTNKRPEESEESEEEVEVEEDASAEESDRSREFSSSQDLFKQSVKKATKPTAKKADDELSRILSAEYINQAQTPAEILKRLTLISNKLSDMDQPQDPEEIPWSENFPQALVDKKFAIHKDSEIRLRVACIIADIIRLTVPEHPFTQVELKRVFVLFIQQLKGLADPEGKLFSTYFYLLERLAQIRVFVLIVDVDSDLVQDLFEALFSSVHLKHQTKVLSYMSDILTSVIESSEMITTSLIELITSKLIVTKEENSRAAFKLARDVLDKTTEHIVSVLGTYLNAQLEQLGHATEKKTDKQRRERLYNIIYQLNLVSSRLLLYIMPNICNNLRDEDTNVRSGVVQLLGNMFAAKESTLTSDYSSVFDDFLSRFQDLDARIREYMARIFAKNVMKNHPSVAEKIIGCLKDRIQDHDDKVRLAVVHTICDIANDNPALVPADLLLNIAERSRDKKTTLRNDTMKALARLYKQQSTQRFDNNEDWDKEALAKFGWIPAKIVRCYHFDGDEQFRLEIEELLENELLSTRTVEERAHSLINIFVSVSSDPFAMQAFSMILKMKKAFQVEVGQFVQLKLADKSKSESDEGTLDEVDKKLEDSRFEKIFSNLASRLPDEEGMHKWKQFNELKDTQVFKLLGKLLRLDTSFEDIEATKEELSKRLASKKPLLEYLKPVFRRVSMSVISSEQVQHTFAWIRNAKDIQNDNAIDARDAPKCLAALDLLMMTAEFYPILFSAAKDDLTHLLDIKEPPTVVDKTLRLINKMGSSPISKWTETNLIKIRIRGLCTDGPNPTQAKLATIALSQFDNAERSYGLALEKLMENLVYGEETAEQSNLLASLYSLREMFKKSPSTLHAVIPQEDTTYAIKIIDFCIDDVLMQNRGDTSERFSEPSLECQIKLAAIKLLAAFIESIASKITIEPGSKDFVVAGDNTATEQMRRVFELLFQILSDKGELIKEDNEEQNQTEKIDKALLVAGATKSIIKLAEHMNIDRMIDIKKLTTIAWLALTEEKDVRRTLYDRVFRGFTRIPQLQLRFMPLLVVGVRDTDKELANSARTYVNKLVHKILMPRVRRHVCKLSDPQATRIFPEYALVYLLHLLAYYPNFEGLAPEYTSLQTILFAYFDEVTADSDNVSFFSALIVRMKQLKHEGNPEGEQFAPRIRLLCDLSQAVLGKVVEGKQFSMLPFPGEIYLPTEFAPESKDKLQAALAYTLPEKFRLNEKARKPLLPQNAVGQAPAIDVEVTEESPKKKAATPKTPGTKKRSRSAATPASKKKTPKKAKETPTVPARERIPRSAKKQISLTEHSESESEEEVEVEEEESTEESEKEEMKPTPKGKQTKAAAAKDKKSETKKKTSPKKPSSAAAAKQQQQQEAEESAGEEGQVEEQEEQEEKPAPAPAAEQQEQEEATQEPEITHSTTRSKRRRF